MQHFASIREFYMFTLINNFHLKQITIMKSLQSAPLGFILWRLHFAILVQIFEIIFVDSVYFLPFSPSTYFSD